MMGLNSMKLKVKKQDKSGLIHNEYDCSSLCLYTLPMLCVDSFSVFHLGYNVVGWLVKGMYYF